MLPNSSSLTDVVVFDIGGSSIRAGLYCCQSNRLKRQARTATASICKERDTPQSSEQAIGSLLEVLKVLLDEVTKTANANVIAVAFPGPIDAAGNALAAPTVWQESFEQPIPVLRSIQNAWPKADVFVLNDVTAAGYCFLRHAEESLCAVTISSGQSNQGSGQRFSAFADSGTSGNSNQVFSDVVWAWDGGSWES